MRVVDEIVWILGQLSLRQHRSEMMDVARAYEQQKQAAHQLCQTVEALEDDADLEGPVQCVLGFEHHRLPPMRACPLQVSEDQPVGLLRAAYTCSAYISKRSSHCFKTVAESVVAGMPSRSRLRSSRYQRRNRS